ncbi:flavin reductase [Micromonospora zingiberis]|uniref:Flavin reductase n=1 Tax=Micromonospora zingiberis TaxID=2053011 RepID=A0A4R0GAS8_9ACTN|nr:flavin reductase family protein [Micromonospora zingiberis]TCB92111.1 flavin reductase [Micromonospora zingiberis]
MHHPAPLRAGHPTLPIRDNHAGAGVTTAGRDRVDQLRPVDPDLFDTLRQRQASTVTVVTAVARNTRPACLGDLGTPLRAGFTATTFTTVSLHPPLVSFCHDPAAPSAPVLDRAEHVAVHLLAANQTEAATIFATRGVDPFAGYPYWEPGPFGLPLLTGVLGRLLCRVVHRIPAGDHAVVIAEPLALSTGIDGDPLLHHHGSYTTAASA